MKNCEVDPSLTLDSIFITQQGTTVHHDQIDPKKKKEDKTTTKEASYNKNVFLMRKKII